jgi:hypothetical protein
MAGAPSPNGAASWGTGHADRHHGSLMTLPADADVRPRLMASEHMGRTDEDVKRLLREQHTLHKSVSALVCFARSTEPDARTRARTRLLTSSILHARCPLPLAAGRTRVLCVINVVDYGPRHSAGLRVLRAAIATLRAEKERVTAELQAQLRAEQERSAALEAQLVRIPTTWLAPPLVNFDFRDGLHRRSLPQLPVHVKASSKPRQEPSRCVPSPISPVARWGEPTTCMRRLARSMSSLHRARHSQRPIRYLSTSPKQPNPLALPCAASVPLRCRFGAAAWARHICAETSIEQCPQRSATSWRPFQRRRRQRGISVASCHMRMGGGAQLEAVMERLVAENMLLARKLAIAEAELRDLQPPPPPLDTPGCAGRRRLGAILQGTRGVLGGA